MKTIMIDDLKVSNIALGCMRIASKSNEEVEQLVLEALDLGINFFDHADIYGGGVSETKFGYVLKKYPELRNKMIIQTKCGIKDNSYDFSKQYIIDSVNGSLERLNTDYIDILLLHRPDALMDPIEVANAFDELYKTGKVKHFGVSNMNSYQIELLQKYCKQKICVNQLQLSLAHTCLIDEGMYVNMKNDEGISRDGNDVLNYCRLNNIAVQAWSILQIDLDRGTFLDSPDYKELNAKLEKYSNKYNVSKSCIAVSWILRHPANIQAIAGTTNLEHLSQLVMANDFELEHDEWYDLYSADKVLA